jgi:ABC-type dipeptide/oligopeptide/nickel transport system permease component
MKSLFKSVLEVALARGLQAIIVAIIVGIVSFLMMQALPGDAAYRIFSALVMAWPIGTVRSR